MSNLRNYLSERKNQIKAQMQALRQELSELALAEEALGKSVGSVVSEPMRKRNGRRTIKDMVLELLSDGSQMEAVKIVEELNNKFGEKIERSSLSPQLSRLKKEKYIQLIDSKWSLLPTDPLSQFQTLESLENPFEDDERIPF